MRLDIGRVRNLPVKLKLQAIKQLVGRVEIRASARQLHHVVFAALSLERFWFLTRICILVETIRYGAYLDDFQYTKQF